MGIMILLKRSRDITEFKLQSLQDMNHRIAGSIFTLRILITVDCGLVTLVATLSIGED